METIKGFVTKVGGGKGLFAGEVTYEGPKGPASTKVLAFGVRFEKGDYFVAEGGFELEDDKYARNRRGATGQPPKKREIFRAKAMRPEIPRDADAVRRWFGEIFNPVDHGATETSIAAFVAKHGAGVALMCERTPEMVVGVSARPDRHRAMIVQDWGRRVSGRRAVTLLEECQVSPAVIAAILAAFRDEAFETLRRNPYQAAAIKKVGFSNADRVGSHIGIPAEDARRISAALVETLDGFAQQGHTYAAVAEIGRAMQDAYSIPVATAAKYIVEQSGKADAPFAIDRLSSGYIAQPRRLYEAETVVSDAVVRMLAHGRRNPKAAIQAAIAELCATEAFSKFDATQRAGVALCSGEPISILTGGPGTGKSAVSKLAVMVAERFDPGPILLCAPTGKAAKRLEETTGRSAVTIHRLLGAREDKGSNTTTFTRNRANPLDAGCLVLVDEASMVDATVMRALVEAMPPDGRLMLVGDRNQLPSVEAGAILGDLIKTEVDGVPLIPQTELVTIYRQGPDSRIATGSVLVRNGELPVLTRDFGSGLGLAEVPTARIVNNVEWLVRRALDEGYTAEQVVVLAPQRKGVAGTWELNERLSRLVNPDGARIEGIVKGPDDEGEPIPRVGDRVMLNENDTENDVMNGDIGVVASAYASKPSGGGQSRNFIKVDFDCGKTVEFPASRWRSLKLAYAVTIHKSQGSQYPVVIMPVTMAHKGMLDRSLLYTGWTRAQRYLFLVGEREALQESVDRTDASARDTRLRQMCIDAARRHRFVPVAMPVPELPEGAAARPARRIPGPAPRVAVSVRPVDPGIALAPTPPPPEPEPIPAAAPEPVEEALPGLPRARAMPSQRPRAAVPEAPAARSGPVPRALASQAPGAPVAEPPRPVAPPEPEPVVAAPPPPVPYPAPSPAPVAAPAPRGPVPRILGQPTARSVVQPRVRSVLPVTAAAGVPSPEPRSLPEPRALPESRPRPEAGTSPEPRTPPGPRTMPEPRTAPEPRTLPRPRTLPQPRLREREPEPEPVGGMAP